MFMLASGARIGEALALIWDEVDLNVGQVEMTHTIIRVKGEGLLRKRIKSKAAAGVTRVVRRNGVERRWQSG
jgi:integrase